MQPTSNWKTVGLGVATIGAAVFSAAKALLSGLPVDYALTLAAITAGWGLIHTNNPVVPKTS